jgi:hypothetical protein
MSSRIAIDLPRDLSEQEQEELAAALRELDEVERADVLGARSIDLETISIGVQLGTQIGSLAAPVFEKIIGLIRGRRIKGVKITFPNGTSLEVDEASGKDLKQLLELVSP